MNAADWINLNDMIFCSTLALMFGLGWISGHQR